METCLEIIGLSNCTDEATSCTIGRWAAQRNTNQQTGTFELGEYGKINKSRSFVYIDIVDIFDI